MTLVRKGMDIGQLDKVMTIRRRLLHMRMVTIRCVRKGMDIGQLDMVMTIRRRLLHMRMVTKR